MSKETKTFIKGAIILSIGGVIAKILSAFFRIPLTHMIEDTGLGYYQMPYPIYTFMIAIAYTGIPSTVSKIISEKLVHKKYGEAHKVFQYTFIVLFFTGIFASLFLFLASDWLIKVQGWVPEAKYSLWGLALSPVFIAIMGAFRGYFQGMQNMIPTATSQISESFARVVFGLGLAYYFITSNYGIAVAAGGASFGATAGGILGSIVLLIYYLVKRKEIIKRIDETKENNQKIDFLPTASKILFIAFPVSVGAAVNSVMNWVDSSLVVRRLLYAGLTEIEASNLYGQIGKAQTFVNVPLTFSMALVVGIVPSIAEAIEKRNNQEVHDKIEWGTRFAMLLGLPSAAGLGILAQPIMTLVYRQYDKGASVLALMSISLVFIILGQAYTGVLQGMGKFYIPVVNLCIAAIAKAVVNYILVAGPLGVNGAAIGSIIGYGVFAILNYIFVTKYSGFKINTSYVILKPLLSTLIMGGATYASYNLLRIATGNTISSLGAVCVGVVVYSAMLLITGAIAEADFYMIPKGDKILALLKKAKFIRSQE
ncbi:MAG: polysaccharide biosynthesis protein [Epulopiscium sp.]|jgi:stage V sporulation protein B|nr:polysaccharide biosynthesis protein [Candidatus Epulonipiscium sp.]